MESVTFEYWQKQSPKLTKHSSFCRADLYREQASKVVFPVVPSSDDDPLLHVVILDGAYSRSHIEICCRGKTVTEGQKSEK